MLQDQEVRWRGADTYPGLMMAIESLWNPQPDRWDRFVARHADGHLLQTSPWGALKAQFGWADERVGLVQGEELIAGAQVVWHTSPEDRWSTGRTRNR
jgi:hypothetical protein